MSTFNTDSFLQTETQEKGSTQLTPIPEGEFPGIIKDLKPRETKTGKHLLDVFWALDDPEVTRVTGMDNPTARQSIWLDLTADMGLDMSPGKNVGLNRLREALGQNVAGKAWSPAQLDGQQAKVTISHRMNGDEVYADVKAVTAL